MPEYETKVQISGTRNGQDWPAVGEPVDLPEDEAAGYIAAGLIGDPDADEETATAPEPETATTKRAPRGSAKAAAAKASASAKAAQAESAPEKKS